MQPEKPRSRALVYVAVGLFLAVAAAHLVAAAAGKSIVRATPLGTALLYAEGKVDLLRPVIVGFTATGTPSALEFPLWQALAAWVFKAAGSTWYGWANLVSLLSLAAGLWPFYRLARQYGGEKPAQWALVFFVVQPIILLMAGMTSADGLALTSSLWFLFFADRLVRTGEITWWLPTAVFGALAAVLKLPFFMTAGLCSVAMLLVNDIWKARKWLLLATAGFAAGLVFAAWTAHTNRIAAQAEFPYAELRMSESPWLVYWYFGDLGYRLRPGAWAKGVWRFTHATMGALPVFVVLVLAFLQSGNWLAKLWLAGVFLTSLLFTHLVLEHWHYYLMACPPVAMLIGSMIASWQPWLARQVESSGLRAGLTLAAILLCSLQGLATMKLPIDLDPFPRQVSEVVRQHTAPGEKLIVWGERAWGGEVLFRSGRQGLSVLVLEGSADGPARIGLKDMLTSEAHLKRLKELGFRKLVLLSESPVQYGAAVMRPGAPRPRMLYPASISPEVDAWPVVFQNEDLIIKEIQGGG